MLFTFKSYSPEKKNLYFFFIQSSSTRVIIIKTHNRRNKRTCDVSLYRHVSRLRKLAYKYDIYSDN